MQLWNELGAQYGCGSLTGEQGLVLTTEACGASGALAPLEAFSNLDVQSQDQAFALASRIMELALSSCPDSRSEASDVENGRMKHL